MAALPLELIRGRQPNRSGAQFLMTSTPTTSGRRVRLIFANLGRLQAEVRPSDDDSIWPKLVVGEGDLWWFTDDDEDTNRGDGPWRSSRATQRSAGCYDLAWQRGGADARVCRLKTCNRG
jgi:hypothetical protein